LLPAKYRPQAHVNYESRLWDHQDSLPKFKGVGFDCPLDNHGCEAGKARVEVKDDTADDGNINDNGQCFCGTVKYSVQGKKIFSFLCHCRECSRNRGTGPVLLIGVVPRTAVKCTEGQAAVTAFEDTRSFCSKCGCLLFGATPEAPFLGVTGATLVKNNPNAPNNGCRLLPAKYRPNTHINYESRTWNQDDNFPKFKGFPQQNCPLTNAGDDAGGAKAEVKSATAAAPSANKYAARHAAVTKFHEGVGFGDKAASSIDAGFDDMAFIATLNESEVDEWSKYLDLKPGFKVKLRQAVAGLRK